MRIARGQSDATRRERRPCHRCGWTADAEKVGRRGARSLGISTALRWLCNDCRDDLGLNREKVSETDVAPERRKEDVGRRIVA
jgi:hypothetical protein